MSQQRSRARRLALQALYQWQLADQDIGDIINQFLLSEDTSRFDIAYFRALLHGVPAHLVRLDAALAPHLTRPIDQVDPVERAVLRLGAFELADHPEIPYRVVINEAVELAKVFGAEQGHRFVNGVLDNLAKDLRPRETGRRRKA